MGLTSTGSNPVFPKMLYNYNVGYVINAININTNHKNLIFKIIFTKKNLVFLRILKSLNFINKFIIFKLNNLIFIKIYAYYFKTKQLGKNFQIISTPSKMFLISFKALRLLHKRTGNSIFILSTDRGLITHHEALLKHVGGKLIGFFSF